MATGKYRPPEPISPSPEPLPYNHRNFSPNMQALNKILKKDGIITNAKAPFVDQGTLNSYCRREFIMRVKDGYIPSEKWFRAIEAFENADVMKATASSHLGKYVEMLHTIRSMNRGAA